MTDEQLQKDVQGFIEGFSKMMLVDAPVVCTVTRSDDGEQQVVNIEYQGEELGYMIGNHGAHLRGLQYVLSLMINKKYSENAEKRIYVNVDISGYKQSRYAKIEQMADRMANEALRRGVPLDMEPMGSAERRVVHMELSKFDGVETESFGEGRDRRVRIIPKQQQRSVKKTADMSMFDDEVALDLLDPDRD